MTASDPGSPGRDDVRDGWEIHADEERLHVLKSSPRQRLEWLEQALHFAEVAGALQARGKDERPERPPA